MKRTILIALAALGCTNVAPHVAPTATAEILTAIGDSTTVIESVALHEGKLYTTTWAGTIYEVDPSAPTPRIVGSLPIPCGYLGEVADSAGNLLIACQDSGTVYRVARERLGAADFDPKKDAQVFITGAGHANGITIARDGHVWISGGSDDALYHAGPEGGKAVLFAEKFSPVSGDTTIPVRAYVTNGAAVDSKGNVYTMNTGTGTIWRLEVKPGYQVGAITKVAESPHLVGADGVIIGVGDTLYATQNISNTFAKISPTGEFTLLVPATGGLHFPAELAGDGKTFYIANLNFPLGPNATGHRPGASIAKVTLP
jgi:outer membrane protein assembly factor BamB